MPSPKAIATAIKSPLTLFRVHKRWFFEDSLAAYRTKVHELLADSEADLFSPTGEALVRDIGEQLDVQYAALVVDRDQFV